MFLWNEDSALIELILAKTKKSVFALNGSQINIIFKIFFYSFYFILVNELTFSIIFLK